ncbi:hypothetical protein Ahy_A10g049965 [Arachis hypogaea]|uniref:Uncharacterized protein n=1 Tax=Arachis hypogaea TaxID=3818 RepID=A0A445B8B3_ARAHY|nr:hypothetical protein Ahy_A10g049965 [Arachis hypogaea]
MGKRIRHRCSSSPPLLLVVRSLPLDIAARSRRCSSSSLNVDASRSASVDVLHHSPFLLFLLARSPVVAAPHRPFLLLGRCSPPVGTKRGCRHTLVVAELFSSDRRTLLSSHRSSSRCRRTKDALIRWRRRTKVEIPDEKTDKLVCSANVANYIASSKADQKIVESPEILLIGRSDWSNRELAALMVRPAILKSVATETLASPPPPQGLPPSVMLKHHRRCLVVRPFSSFNNRTSFLSSVSVPGLRPLYCAPATVRRAQASPSSSGRGA